MKLIDKVVTEIERLQCFFVNKRDDFEKGYHHGLDMVLSFLDTFDTKEVDLKKEFYDFLDTLTGKDNGHLSEDELFRIAEYFYELALTQNKEENV